MLQEFQKTYVERSLDRIAMHILEQASHEASLASKWYDGPPEKAPFSPERLKLELTSDVFDQIKPTIDKLIQEYEAREDDYTMEDIRQSLVDELQLDPNSFAATHQNTNA